MLVQNSRFLAASNKQDVRPRLTIDIQFSNEPGDRVFFTSHVDAGRPDGFTVVEGCVESFGGGTQKIDAKNSSSSIGSIHFSLVDVNGEISTLLAARNASGYSLRNKTVTVYLGYGAYLTSDDSVVIESDDPDDAVYADIETVDWLDYSRQFTMIIKNVSIGPTSLSVVADDVQRLEVNDIFDPQKTTLTESISADQMHIPSAILETSEKFQLVEHDSAYTDRPDETVAYIIIEKEIIAHSGITNDETYGVGFSVVQRGALNSRAIGHAVDANASDDRKTPITEYIYLEGPALKLLYAIQTGLLYGQNGAVLPSHWHHGIAPEFIRLEDYLSADRQLWNPDTNAGRMLRFSGLAKVNGQKFIESEILSWLVGVRPVYADGSIGFRGLSSVLSDSDYIYELNNRNIVTIGKLNHKLSDVVNRIAVRWDYSAQKKIFLQTTEVNDVSSIVKYGDGTPKTLEFKGVKSSNQTDHDLRAMFDNYRNRYAGGGYELSVEVLPKINFLEVGDTVLINTPHLTDPLTGAHLKRVFEVQQISRNWRTGRSKLSLFASTEAAGEFEVITGGNVLDDAFYVERAIALGGSSVASLPQYSGGIITADCTLGGGANLQQGIWYCDGDLTIAAGVTVTVTDNVQLRVRGTFTRNGDIIGRGKGLLGGAGGSVFTATGTARYETGLSGSGTAGIYSAVRGNTGMIATDEQPGVSGYMGVSRASNFLLALGGASVSGGTIQWRSQPGAVRLAGGYIHAPELIMRGRNTSAERLNLLNRDGLSLDGINDLDLRGTSGPGAKPLMQVLGINSLNGLHEILQPGGGGGNGGAGLMVVCRGESVGVSSVVDLSGDEGTANPLITVATNGNQIANGGGGGGQPGAYYLLIDGSASFGSSTQNVTQQRGLSGIAAGASEFVKDDSAGVADWPRAGVQYPCHFGRELAPVVDFGQSGFKVQYIPARQSISQLPEAPPKYTLQPVSGLQLHSGESEMLPAGDGAVRERIRVTWEASTEAGAEGYEVQAQVLGIEWRTVAVINDIATAIAYFDVTDGEQYSARVRVLGEPDITEPSNWLTTGSHTAVGKSVAPVDPVGFSVAVDPNQGVVFTVDAHPAPDFSHYRIYRNATELLRGDFIRAAWERPTVGAHSFSITAFDRSGNASGSTGEVVVIEAPGVPVVSVRYAGGAAVIEWTAAPGSMATDAFIVRRGAVEIARQKSTHYMLTVNFSGAETYSVIHTDIAGNESVAASVVVEPERPATPNIEGQYNGVAMVMTWQDCATTLPISHYNVTVTGKTYRVAQPYFSTEVNWQGNSTAEIGSVDVAGNKSAVANFLIAPQAPAAPVLSVQVIDNSITVRHRSASGSLPVREYRIFIGDTYNPAGQYETAGGDESLSVLDQVAAGTYTLWVLAVDSAGNLGALSSVAAVVSQPPDYVLVAEHSVKVAGWPGVKTNCFVNESNALLLPVIVGETWAQHFVNNDFTTPAQQIDAGFEKFLQPSASIATYVGEYDYGTVIPSSMVTFASAPEVLDGNVTASVTLSYRETTGDSWTQGPVGQPQIFAEAFRYVRFDVTYTAADGDDLATVEDMVIKIDKKLVKDAGSAVVNAADSGGTFVPFNLGFISAYAPSVVFPTTLRHEVVVDFSGGPNPAGFYVYLFNSVSGVRLSGGIDWYTNGFTGV